MQARSRNRRGIIRPTCGRSLLRSRDGVALVEFAIVAPVFLLMVLITMQLALAMLTQMTLDNGVSVAARQVQLGNITTPAAFITTVCKNVVGLSANCPNNLSVQSSSGQVFTDLSDSGFGTNGSYVQIETRYTAPYINSWLAQIMNGTNGTFISEVAFQNEP